MSKKQRFSLAEQIAQLADPRPSSFNPDEDERDQLGAVSLGREDSEDERDHVQHQLSSLRVTSWEDDPRYAGRPVSRKEIEQDDQDEEEYSANEESDEESEVESVLEENNTLLEDEMSDVSPSDDVSVDQSNLSTHMVKEEEVEQPFPTLSVQSMQDELEKSRAVKHQTELWDRLLEARIHLHKVLPLSNRLPEDDMLPVFKKAGRTTLNDALSTNESSLRKLLDQLLELQQCLLHQNTETRSALLDEPEEEVNEEDEEILSDEADGSMEDNTTITQAAKIGKRKRQQRDWELERGGRDYESYINGMHERLNPFVYETIDKWNKKLRLTTDKATSKSFIQVDKSVVGQIRHILLDKQRLVRRTQLKRSHYKVLGKYDTEKHEEEDQDQVDDKNKSKDYSEEIFDDDDFYHQLLRNLIERRMSATESTDAITMGRDWLQLQQLRSKVKRKSVDTKASKGRKLRYEVHQKLVSFMSPVEQGTMPDSARNDLFASLFGARSAAARQQQL